MVINVTILKGNSFYGWPKNINVIDHMTLSQERPTLSQFSSFVFLLGEMNIFFCCVGLLAKIPWCHTFQSIAPHHTSQNPTHTFSILVFLWVSCTVPKTIFSLFQIPRSQNLQVLLNMWRFTYIKDLEKGPSLSLWALLEKGLMLHSETPYECLHSAMCSLNTLEKSEEVFMHLELS